MEQNDWAWLDLLEECYDQPLLFVTGILRLPDKFEGCPTCGAPVRGVGAKAASTCDCPGVEPWQHYALIAVGEGDRVSIRSGHGVGKTAWESWITWWFICTRRNCKVPIISPSSDGLRDTIWPELSKWHARLPKTLADRYEVMGEKVILKADPKSCFAVARTAPAHKPEALQGFHAEQLIDLIDPETGESYLVSVANLMVIIDEASGLLEQFFEVSRGALSGKGTKMIMAGNPTRTSGTFYNSHHKLRHIYKCFHVSCLNVPRAQGHVEEIVADYGEESNAYRVRVLGDFPTQDDDTVIPLDIVLAAVCRDIGDTKKSLVMPVWGLDVARFGDDRVALAKRRDWELLEPIKYWGKVDATVTVGRVVAEYRDTHPDLRPHCIVVDSAGMGGPFVDMLRQEFKGQPVQIKECNVSELPAIDERRHRLRDELWFQGQEWFTSRRCRIPEGCDVMIGELTTVTYTFTGTGKTIVESKKDMKKRGLRSPDEADALLLTFNAPLKRKVDTPKRNAGRGHSAWAA